MKLHGSLASPCVGRVVLFSRPIGLNLVPEMPTGGLKDPTYLARAAVDQFLASLASGGR